MFKNIKKSHYSILLVALVIAVASGVFFYFYSDFHLSAKTEETVTLSLNGRVVEARVANDSWERIQGLSGVLALSEEEGMLFVFEERGSHGIWMKDMNFPIDIIWLNESLEVVHIAPYVSPDTYPQVFEPDEPARYVLEVHAGLAADVGLQENDKVEAQRGGTLVFFRF